MKELSTRARDGRESLCATACAKITFTSLEPDCGEVQGHIQAVGLTSM